MRHSKVLVVLILVLVVFAACDCYLFVWKCFVIIPGCWCSRSFLLCFLKARIAVHLGAPSGEEFLFCLCVFLGQASPTVGLPSFNVDT